MMVLIAAWEVFRREGYSGTTMDAVAQQAGMSKRTLYQLFPGKDSLFEAIITANGKKLVALPRPQDDAPLEQALAEIFRADMPPEKLDLLIGVMRLTCQEAAQHDEFRELFIEYGPMKGYNLLTEWLEGEKARGRLDFDDAGRTAAILFDMAYGPYDVIPGQERFIKPVSHKEHIERVVRLFLYGVARAARPQDAESSACRAAARQDS